MKSTAILTVLMAGFCISTFTCIAQTATQSQKNVNVVIKEDLKKVQLEMTKMADSTYHQLDLDKDLKGKKVTVTVIESSDGTGKSSTYTYSIGDTLQSKEAQKAVRSVGGKRMIIMQNGKGENFDLPVNPPSVQAIRIMGHPLSDAFAFDPTDTTIVSYHKKEMGKGLEKITIVRKKAVLSK